MRPKELAPPFSWKERRPLFKDNVLYLPSYCKNCGEVETLYSCYSLLSRFDKRAIEYCSGNGDWLIDQALARPDVLWIGVEKRFDRVRKIFSKRFNRNVHNLFIVCGQAEDFTKHYLSEDTMDAIFINFPDPWPKRRHTKHRLMTKDFSFHLHRVLRRGGTLTFVTDDKTYHEEACAVLNSWRLESQAPIENYGASFFKNLWEDKGRAIRYLRYVSSK